MRTRPIIALVLLSVAVVAGMAVWDLRPRPKPRVPTSDRSDYTLVNFELVTLDEKGIEAFTVKAPHLERDPKGKNLTLRTPTFSFPDKDGGRWVTTSREAWVADRAVEVRLIDDVLMLGPEGPAGGRTRFNTTFLQVFPKKNLAQTDAAVTITQSDSILTGIGMRADMQAHRFELLSAVKGRYAPRSR